VASRRPPAPGAPITATAWGPGASWLLEALPGLLGAQDEPETFAPVHPLLREVARRHRGLRVGRSGRVLEALVPAVLERRIEERTREMFDAGVEEEVQRALAAPISATARKTLGLDEVAGLPCEEAVAAIIVRTRRYAAYQRKWMRRVSGLVMVDANRPPGDIADDIVALARPRERLPRR